MKTFQVTLPDDSAALVEKMLQDGPWDSIDELFLNSIGTLQEDVAADENIDIEELKTKIRDGLDDLDVSGVTDGDEVFRELIASIDSDPVAQH